MRTTIVIASLLALAACKSHPERAESAEPAYPDISVADAAALMASDPDVVVLDIRTPAEFEAGHLPGAVLMDCKAADFVEQLKTLDPSKTYVMH
ncbi:MAG: rhodanese-like domain-containing protein [Planctomycetota bacterium]